MGSMLNNLSNNINTRTGAAKLSMTVIITLIILKVAVSILSRSISIFAQAADSLLDLFSTGITLIAVKISGTPADEKHPFGHGKAEGISALIQSVMVLGAGIFIIYSAVQRIIKSEPIVTEEGIIVMLISIIASYFLSRHLRKVASSTGSMAIEASARNIRTDVYSATGVLIGLLMVRLTGLTIFDPIIAIGIAVLVLKAGVEILINAFHELADYELPKEELQMLAACFSSYNTQIVDFHALRSRRAGMDRFIDLHLTMPRNTSVEDAHTMCDHLENEIRDRLSNSDITIHIEPCTKSNCQHCKMEDCSLRNK